MNKTEEIIKVAIEGNYMEAPKWEFQYANQYWAIWKNGNGNLTTIDVKHYFLDPKFFQAIGKAKGYKRYYCVHCKKDFDKVGLITCDDCGKVGHKETMIHHAMEAYYTNLTQSFDDAINYLYELIK